MGRRLPRHTARKSMGERRLPDTTNNARDSSEDGSEVVRARGLPREAVAEQEASLRRMAGLLLLVITVSGWTSKTVMRARRGKSCKPLQLLHRRLQIVTTILQEKI